MFADRPTRLIFHIEQDSAVVAAATYGQRYITDRKLPDKAIDLLDEAASRLRLQQVHSGMICSVDAVMLLWSQSSCVPIL